MMELDLRKLELRDMSPDEMKATYEGHMQYVFPPQELKPCGEIYSDMLVGKFMACGLYNGDELLAYAFTARDHARPQLFGQYIVVMERYRSMGVGGTLLDRLMEKYSGYRCFMADVEDPEYASDADEKALRERRIRFYVRNGFRRTRVKCNAYGVDYEIIVRDLAASPDGDEIMESAAELYRSMSKPGAYPKMFKLRIEKNEENK